MGMIRRVVPLLVAYLVCSEVLARLQRTVLDPAGHPDPSLLALTGVTLMLRLVVFFGLPFLLVAGWGRSKTR